MEVSQLSLARMLLSCFLGGVGMGFVYELLLLPRLLLFGELSSVPQRLQKRLQVPLVLRPFARIKRIRKTTAIHKIPVRRIGSALLLGFADVLFCLLCAVLLLLLLYATNHGEFRYSALFSLLLGVFLCRMTLLRLLSFVIQCAYVVLRSIMAWTSALLSYPMLRSGIFFWRCTALPRQRIRNRYEVYRQRKIQRKEQRKHQKEYIDAVSSNIENGEPSLPRPAPDGRRVFCAGVSHGGRR